jgi:hypothetical protein
LFAPTALRTNRRKYMADSQFDTTAMSSITVEELMALERMVYEDLMRRQLRTSYSVRDQMFTFATIQQAREFLEWVRGEISIRQEGGGFSLASFTGA